MKIKGIENNKNFSNFLFKYFEVTLWPQKKIQHELQNQDTTINSASSKRSFCVPKRGKI